MATNKEIADAFRRALSRLWDGHGERPLDLPTAEQKRRTGSEYICNALTEPIYVEVPTEADHAAAAIVYRRLKGFTFRSWWIEEHKLFEESFTHPQWQSLRRQFVLDLIEEFDPQKVDPVEA